MAFQVTEIVFDRDDAAEVVAAMQNLHERGDGLGWVNLQPCLSADQFGRVPERSGLAGWFSGRGPALPLATWTPPTVGARPVPAQLGLAHGTGPNGLDRLETQGVTRPSGWVKRQDHAKHGIVMALPDNVDLLDVVGWMVAAVTGLCQVVEPGSLWQAMVHQPAN